MRRNAARKPVTEASARADNSNVITYIHIKSKYIMPLLGFRFFFWTGALVYYSYWSGFKFI